MTPNHETLRIVGGWLQNLAALTRHGQDGPLPAGAVEAWYREDERSA